MCVWLLSDTENVRTGAAEIKLRPKKTHTCISALAACVTVGAASSAGQGACNTGTRLHGCEPPNFAALYGPGAASAERLGEREREGLGVRRAREERFFLRIAAVVGGP